MMNKLIRSSLPYLNLPFNIIDLKEHEDYFLVSTDQNNEYYLVVLTKKEYAIYLDLISYSAKIKKAIYEQKYNNLYYLFFAYESNTDVETKIQKIPEILQELFQNTSFEITLKKEHLANLNNIYKVLDNKFAYLEMRIREIETNPKKDDVSWIILSKYNVVLDARIFLYDLQTDIFKAIDQKHIVKYGLMYKRISIDSYNKMGILPSFDLYYAPISMLYCRLYLELNVSVIEDIKKIDVFNQKYFCFMTLYILILNLNIEIILNNYATANYLLLTKKIRKFIDEYKEIMKK